MENQGNPLNDTEHSTGKMVLQLSGCYWHPWFLCGIDYMF